MVRYADVCLWYAEALRTQRPHRLIHTWIRWESAGRCLIRSKARHESTAVLKSAETWKNNRTFWWGLEIRRPGTLGGSRPRPGFPDRNSPIFGWVNTSGIDSTSDIDLNANLTKTHILKGVMSDELWVMSDKLWVRKFVMSYEDEDKWWVEKVGDVNVGQRPER